MWRLGRIGNVLFDWALGGEIAMLTINSIPAVQ
jgi:hypothetical protein